MKKMSNNKKIIDSESYPIFSSPSWRFLNVTINNFQSLRVHEKKDDLRKGLNYSIVLLSACYLEGFLTNLLWYLHRFSDKPQGKKDFQLYNELETKILRSDGIDKFNKTTELVTGKKLSNSVSNESWEAAKILFQLRNLLAHGKEIRYYMTPLHEKDGKAYFPTNAELFWDAESSGRRIEDFLIKRNLISKKDKRPNPNDFFSDEVSNYFYDLTKKFLTEFKQNLDQNSKKLFDFVDAMDASKSN